MTGKVLTRTRVTMAVAVLVVAAVVGVVAVRWTDDGGRTGDDGPDAAAPRFDTLARAIAAGRVSPELLEALERDGEVEAIVSFRGAGLIERFLTGPDSAGPTAEAVDSLREALSGLKDRTFSLLGSEIEVLESYRYLPTAHVRFRSERGLLLAANAPFVEGLASNVELITVPGMGSGKTSYEARPMGMVSTRP